MRYGLGFDGGGSNTDCVLMDESGAIRARSRSGPYNPARVPLDLAYAALLQAAAKALDTGGKSVTDVVSVCGAIAAAGLASALPGFHRRLQIKLPGAPVF